VSLVDKDARHGAKSDKKTFTGYKANVMKSEDGFVTNIEITPGNTYDAIFFCRLLMRRRQTVLNRKKSPEILIMGVLKTGFRCS
jgi:hypothetical protein